MKNILDLLVRESGMPELAIRKIVANAPVRYKEYSIPKRSGGYRAIAQPAKELKVLQTILVDRVISKFPIHDAAKAYRRNTSIRDNALPHAGQTQILKMDFKDFFPSILISDWRSYCKVTGNLTAEIDIEIMGKILFHKPHGSRLLRLAIGAPSSPSLSNALMFQFDSLISEEVARDKVTYTRYADDLTFSAPRTGHLNSVARAVRKVLQVVEYPSLALNHTKTTFVTMKYGRNVTGMVLANDGRVTIGRDKKRIIRARIDHFLKNQLSDDDKASLGGWIAHIHSVENDYYLYLVEHYSLETIQAILRSHQH